MLNTFFFGYLSKRWKRLARVLTWVFYPISLLIGYDIDRSDGTFFVSIIYPILIILISYTLKPFLIRDSE